MYVHHLSFSQCLLYLNKNKNNDGATQTHDIVWLLTFIVFHIN